MISRYGPRIRLNNSRLIAFRFPSTGSLAFTLEKFIFSFIDFYPPDGIPSMVLVVSIYIPAKIEILPFIYLDHLSPIKNQIFSFDSRVKMTSERNKKKKKKQHLGPRSKKNLVFRYDKTVYTLFLL